VKKGIVVLLVLLAALVLVSPALVGRLAERSMEENIDWAAMESGAIKVESEHYARGWFSSEGRHRIELQEGDLLKSLQMLTGPLDADDLPVLVINTRLDHGPIPVSSMTREHGSLAPGLGSAVSTLQLETPDGELIDLPGTIFSKVALDGALQSNYVLEAGSRSADGMTASWGEADVDVTTNPASGKVALDGRISELSVGDGDGGVRLDGLVFSGNQQPTPFGVATGNVDIGIDSMTVGSKGMVPGMSLAGASVKARSRLQGDRVDGDAAVRFDLKHADGSDDFSLDMLVDLSGADATAIGALQRAATRTRGTTDPLIALSSIEPDAKRLLAKGFTLNVPRYNLTVPEGTLAADLAVTFAEADPDTFEWATLLLSTDAELHVAVPAALVEAMGQDSPQIAMAIGGGYLVKKGDVYELNAQLRKGLLTVNGAPIPIPLGQLN